MKPELLYPYIVTKEYLEHGAPQPDGFTKPLGQGVYATLVCDLNGLVRNVLPTELAQAGLSSDEALARAQANLEKMIQSQTIHSAVLPKGPHGKPFVLFGGHWGAASVCTWSGLHRIAARALGTERLVLSIPHREALIIFADGESDYITAMQEMIRENEADGTKPLTWDLFVLAPDGLKPKS
ncbi:hypothetical protein [Prosthecobacter sp.]|uniref:hypothetical protein n=1 Tax=Prosthecobacter sp. TaxID=1965333 RepID=UPI003785133E